jgi:hypothetical protein
MTVNPEPVSKRAIHVTSLSPNLTLTSLSTCNNSSDYRVPC